MSPAFGAIESGPSTNTRPESGSEQKPVILRDTYTPGWITPPVHVGPSKKPPSAAPVALIEASAPAAAIEVTSARRSILILMKTPLSLVAVAWCEPDLRPSAS